MKELPDLSSRSHAQKDELIRTLWAMVQSLTARVETLTAEVDALKGRLATQYMRSIRSSPIGGRPLPAFG
jgi:hypothetical protein